MLKKPHIVVIDPAVVKPELEAFNRLAHLSPLPLTYHLPGLYGVRSLLREDEGLKGIIVMGSAISVHERTDWQKSLEEWLDPWMAKAVPTFGICYGHQMIAHHFGGKIDHTLPTKEKRRGMREVELLENRLWGKSMTGNYCISHNEIVKVAPADFDVVGRSKDVAIDAIAHKTLPIWSFQFHPEAGPEFINRVGYTHPNDDDPFEFGTNLIRHYLEFVKKNK